MIIGKKLSPETDENGMLWKNKAKYSKIEMLKKKIKGGTT
jgi:hypothetical protein